MDTTIERATLEDAEEILNLQKLAYQSEAALHGEYDIPPLTQTLEGMRADLEKQVILKATSQGRILGSVRGYLSDGTCYVGRLIVHPDVQNRGLGTRLMSEIENLFRGAQRFELFTGHKSERNLNLYRKLGYQPFQQEQVSEALTLIFLEKLPCLPDSTTNENASTSDTVGLFMQTCCTATGSSVTDWAICVTIRASSPRIRDKAEGDTG